MNDKYLQMPIRKVWVGPLTESFVIAALENAVANERKRCTGIIRKHLMDGHAAVLIRRNRKWRLTKQGNNT